VSVAGYPQAFGSDRDLLDVRGTLAFAVPLPFTQRHSLVASVLGRGLLGAPAGALRVGGVATGLSVFQSHSPLATTLGPRGYLPGTLAESLRGYDDQTFRTEAVAIAQARYRYSLIIDRGTASILWLFPSFFARQVDLEAFMSAALTWQRQWLRAVGGAATFRFSVMDVFPISLAYQYAWRFDGRADGLHQVFLSLE
jgi:hypothetical protein